MLTPDPYDLDGEFEAPDNNGVGDPVAPEDVAPLGDDEDGIEPVDVEGDDIWGRDDPEDDPSSVEPL